MTNKEKHILRELYEKAIALWGSGFECTPEFLCKEFGITEYKAACLFYMLWSGEYCPELEGIYSHEDNAKLIGKDEHACPLVEFLQDMPPYRRLGVYADELSNDDKKHYVAMGVAEWQSYEEYRLTNLHMYVTLSRILKERQELIREAIKNKDYEFLTEKFEGGSAQKVTAFLKQEKFEKHEIAAVLEILDLS